MEVRVLGAGDEAALALAVELSDEGPLTSGAAAAHLADADLVAVAALEGEAAAGFAYGHVLRRFEATSFFIYSVDVAEPFRRRGVATAMLSALAERARALGCREMFVFTEAGNAAAMALYAGAGGVRPNLDDVMFDFDL